VGVCLQTHDPLAMLKSKGYLGGGSPQNEAKKGASKTQCSKTITQIKNRQRRWL
jgi:hypothetical protein